MIVYYMEKRKYRTHPMTRAKVYRGMIQVYDQSRSRAIRLGTPTNHRPVIIFKATIFDDSVQPPKLIRCDYGFKELSDHGADVPPLYIDNDGSIVRSNDDVIVMAGPGLDTEKPKSWRAFNSVGERLSIPTTNIELPKAGFYP